MQINSVLRRMTAEKYANLTEQANRLAQANLRLAQIEAEQEARKRAAIAWECRQITALGRMEYVSLRHAAWKEKLYERAVRRDEWDAFQMRKLRERYMERERKKDEWQAFLLAPVDPQIDLTNLPKF